MDSDFLYFFLFIINESFLIFEKKFQESAKKYKKEMKLALKEATVKEKHAIHNKADGKQREAPMC